MSTIRFADPDGSPPRVGQYSTVAFVPASAATIHLAGHLPLDADGKLVGAGDFAAQANAVFASLARTLEGAGSSLRDVAMLRAFVVGEEHLPRFRDARAKAYEATGVVEPPPATTVLVAGLIGGSLIELDAVAVAAAS